jgi:Acetyltransferase (GNAT) domain
VVVSNIFTSALPLLFLFSHIQKLNHLCVSTKALHTDIQQALKFMRNSVPSAEKPWNEKRAILLRPSLGFPEISKPKMIGSIGIVREQEVGYGLHSDFWGKGYMTEAMRMFIDIFWKTERMYLFLSASQPLLQCGKSRVAGKPNQLKRRIQLTYTKFCYRQ